jgi:hypothetical protein
MEKRLNLRPNPDALDVVPFEPGEATRTMRVRAEAAVIEWAAGLTAAQRGAVMTAVYRAATQAPPASPQAPQRPASGPKSSQAIMDGALLGALEAGAQLVAHGAGFELWRSGQRLMIVGAPEVDALRAAELITERVSGVWVLTA